MWDYARNVNYSKELKQKLNEDLKNYFIYF